MGNIGQKADMFGFWYVIPARSLEKTELCLSMIVFGL